MDWLALRSVLSRVLWAVAALGASFGIIQLASVATSAQSSPQQAAGAAMAAAYAVLPYVVARAFDQITTPVLE